MPSGEAPTTPEQNRPEDPLFSLEDISEHTISYGVDIVPQIEPAKETLRAHQCFVQLREKYPALFDTLTAGSQFAISSSFEGSNRVRFPFMTLGVNPRGPVFQFPIKGVQYGGKVDLHNVPDFNTVFQESLNIILENFARKVMQVGVTRNLVFNTGVTDCAGWLGSKVLQFDDADLVGGQCNLMYKRDTAFIQIQMASIEIQTNIVSMIAGNPQSQISRPEGRQFGLATTIVVGSISQNRPMEPHEIQAVLEESDLIWPKRFIEFLNSRKLK